MQSEIKHYEFIIEFTLGVPKYYAYRLITDEGEKTVCKFRGIILNYHASNLVNFEVIRAMILEKCVPLVNVYTEHRTNARGGQVGQ